MRAVEFITENKTTLNKLYGGNFPDRDESFWDEVRPDEFDKPLEIKTMPKHKLAIMLQGQYRVEHLDEILDMMDEDQQEILQRYMNDPNLSNKIILLSGDRIIDGNHRALAAAMRGVSINYVDLADLDEQDVTEAFDKEAGAWREWQLKMLPRKMEMLSRLVKGWVPSEEDHIAAIEAGYVAMRDTGDVKDAAKAIADTLKEIQSRQGVAEDTANLPSVLYHATYKPRLKSIKLKGLGAGGKRNWEDSKRGIVYLSLDPNVAESYAETSDMVPEEWLDEIVILKISTAGLDPNKFHIDSNVQDNAGDTVEYHGVIPVSNISLYKQGVTEGKQQVERNGIQLNVSIDGATVDIRPMINGNQIGYVVFDRDGKTLVADDLAIDEKYRGRGIAKIIYDYVKELGFTVKRSTDQLAAGKAFWDKYKGAQGQVWEDENVDEMALSTYKTMGDFSKPGPFTGADKKLVPHPKNIEKATRFFEQTPFDFRLFFSHLKGTGKYSEHGPMSPDEIRKVFGQDAEEIINGSEDAITVVYVGNKGDSKVMLTPWMMAHRFGHAVNRGAYRAGSVGAWKEAEKHFFNSVNGLLNDYYGKLGRSSSDVKYELTPEYNALFNAIGTQRSSRNNEIRRPYEFFYELFAQYLGTGQITLNPFPTNLTYGRKAWGNPTRFMNIKPEYRDETERKYAAEVLARDMEILFNDVLGDSVGKIFVM